MANEMLIEQVKLLYSNTLRIVVLHEWITERM